jgi:hypothetical protein
MKIPITSTKEKFFQQLIELLSNFVPIKKLSKRQKDVLAEILYQNYRFKDHNENERRILVFSKDIRREMSKKIGISNDNLYTQLNFLRRAGVLDKDNRLPKFLSYILPNDKFEFTIYFNLVEDE